jgi:CheY-like chemotaxis protein
VDSLRLKILLAEDDSIMREAMAEMITKRIGITPKLASDGAEAIEIVESWQPDILITDTNMPLKNGVELIQEVRGKYPQILIFSLFSGLEGSRITADEIKAMGAYLVLDKMEIHSRLLPILELLVKDRR